MAEIHIPRNQKLSDKDRIDVRRWFKGKARNLINKKLAASIWGCSHHTITKVLNGN